MPRLTRRRLGALSLLLPIGGTAGAAEPFPDHNVRLVVPFTPAGQTDTLARLFGQRLQEQWGRPVVVENRAGGNALIGADHVAKSAPDGHTLLVITLAHAINASLFAGQAPYDFLRDLRTVSVLGALPLVVVVRAEAPWRSLAELVAAARGGRLNGGSSGIGTPPHLGLEILRGAAGAGDNVQHVPYRGGAPSVTDLIAGNLDLIVSNLPECIAQVQGGRLRALAVTGDARHPLLPAVPTAAEAGLPALRITSWTAVQVPSATPEPLVRTLGEAFAAAAAQPELRRKAAELGFDLRVEAPGPSQAFVAAEVARFARIVAAAGMKPE